LKPQKRASTNCINPSCQPSSVEQAHWDGQNGRRRCHSGESFFVSVWLTLERFIRTHFGKTGCLLMHIQILGFKVKNTYLKIRVLKLANLAEKIWRGNWDSFRSSQLLVVLEELNPIPLHNYSSSFLIGRSFFPLIFQSFSPPNPKIRKLLCILGFVCNSTAIREKRFQNCLKTLILHPSQIQKLKINSKSVSCGDLSSWGKANMGIMSKLFQIPFKFKLK